MNKSHNVLIMLFQSVIIITSKRDTQSRCSLKTWSRAGYKLSADLSRVTPEQKTVLRV